MREQAPSLDMQIWQKSHQGNLWVPHGTNSASDELIAFQGVPGHAVNHGHKKSSQAILTSCRRKLQIDRAYKRLSIS